MPTCANVFYHLLFQSRIACLQCGTGRLPRPSSLGYNNVRLSCLFPPLLSMSIPSWIRDSKTWRFVYEEQSLWIGLSQALIGICMRLRSLEEGLSVCCFWWVDCCNYEKLMQSSALLFASAWSWYPMPVYRCLCLLCAESSVLMPLVSVPLGRLSRCHCKSTRAVWTTSLSPWSRCVKRRHMKLARSTAWSWMPSWCVGRECPHNWKSRYGGCRSWWPNCSNSRYQWTVFIFPYYNGEIYLR